MRRTPSPETCVKMSASQLRRFENPAERSKLSEARRSLPLGDKQPGWKGDAVGYKGLHKWVRNQLGLAAAYPCFANLDSLHSARDWANISGEYRRDVQDFIPLCRLHHQEHDRP